MANVFCVRVYLQSRRSLLPKHQTSSHNQCPNRNRRVVQEVYMSEPVASALDILDFRCTPHSGGHTLSLFVVELMLHGYKGNNGKESCNCSPFVRYIISFIPHYSLQIFRGEERRLSWNLYNRMEYGLRNRFVGAGGVDSLASLSNPVMPIMGIVHALPRGSHTYSTPTVQALI